MAHPPGVCVGGLVKNRVGEGESGTRDRMGPSTPGEGEGTLR